MIYETTAIIPVIKQWITTYNTSITVNLNMLQFNSLKILKLK